jgi:hypothetical protein
MDEAGGWFHIMNRAVGKRAMFESDRDVSRFLDRIRRATERGWIEVSAYAILQTHYHLLGLSPRAELSRALHLIQGPYGQWFNLTRERDGPIHRSRFVAKRVDSVYYQRTLVEYIDMNPVTAGLSTRPELYPHGSAWHYARPSGPDWLSRGWIEAEVAAACGTSEYDPARYGEVFHRRARCTEVEQLVLADLASPDDGVQPIDFLLSTTSVGRARWLEERARHADGTRALRPLVTAGAVDRALAATDLPTAVRAGRQRGNHGTRSLAAVTLLRALAGMSTAAIADHIGCSLATVHRLRERANLLTRDEPAFLVALGQATKAALDDHYAPWLRPPVGGTAARSG